MPGHSGPAGHPRPADTSRPGRSSTPPRDAPAASSYQLPERPAVTDQPSWPRVIVTTVHLWLERRAGREPAVTGGGPPAGEWPAPGGPPPAAPRSRSRRWAGALGLAIVVFAAGALTITLAQRASHSPARAGSSASRGTTTAASPAASQLSPAALAQATANRQQAATWIAAQVSHSEIVGCDPVMCAALQARGFPAGDLLPLPADAPDPMGSQLVVATTAVRSQFGARLADVYAPVIIASFGAGAARVDVRVEAPEGSQAYLIAQRADLLARQEAGRQLLGNRNFHVAGVSKQDIAAGRVDSRLLITLAAVAAQEHKVYVTSFGEAGPNAAAAVPLRMVRIAALAGGLGRRRGAYQHAVTKFLHAQRPPFLGQVSVLHQGGRTMIQLQFPAPAPLGLLGEHAAP